MTKTKEKTHYGKPMSHWEAEARKLVVDTLVRKGLGYRTNDPAMNIVHDLASKQFLALADGISPRDAADSRQMLNQLTTGLGHVIATFTKSGKLHKVGRRPARKRKR